MVNNAIELDDVFGALASQPRRTMIAMLREGSHNMTELAVPLKISLPAMHKHVAILEKARLITRTKVGREQRIVLQPTALTGAEEWIEYHKDFWTKQLDGLEEHIIRKKGEI
jgi:DNA-binding transcriptional ArsR family regulator